MLHFFFEPIHDTQFQETKQTPDGAFYVSTTRRVIKVRYGIKACLLQSCGKRPFKPENRSRQRCASMQIAVMGGKFFQMIVPLEDSAEFINTKMVLIRVLVCHY